MANQRNVEALRKRAVDLIARSPAAAEMIQFYVSAVADGTLGAAPPRVLNAAAGLTPEMADLFARLEIRRNQYAPPDGSQRCASCGALPQFGILRPEGHGSALSLACSMCLHEWSHKRDTCPACAAAGKLVFYSTPELPNVQVQACDACKRYLHLIDLGKDPASIPELDELAAVTLDVWARDQSYEKVRVNLAGI